MVACEFAIVQKTEAAISEERDAPFGTGERMIHLNIRKPKETANSERYIETITMLKDRISTVSLEKKRTFLLKHENARSRIS